MNILAECKLFAILYESPPIFLEFIGLPLNMYFLGEKGQFYEKKLIFLIVKFCNFKITEAGVLFDCPFTFECIPKYVNFKKSAKIFNSSLGRAAYYSVVDNSYIHELKK